jgi:hypothetical protein
LVRLHDRPVEQLGDAAGVGEDAAAGNAATLGAPALATIPLSSRCPPEQRMPPPLTPVVLFSMVLAKSMVTVVPAVMSTPPPVLPVTRVLFSVTVLLPSTSTPRALESVIVRRRRVTVEVFGAGGVDLDDRRAGAVDHRPPAGRGVGAVVVAAGYDERIARPPVVRWTVSLVYARLRASRTSSLPAAAAASSAAGSVWWLQAPSATAPTV